MEEEVEEEEDEAEDNRAEGEGSASAGPTHDAAPARDIVADARTRASLTIVIQPGSDNLRIGRATDPSPTVIPHCIARLWKNGRSDSPANAERTRPPTEAELRDRDKELVEVERGMKRWNAPTRKAGSGPGDAAEEEIAELPPDPSGEAAPADGARCYVGEEALARVSCAPRADGSAYVFRRPIHRSPAT